MKTLYSYISSAFCTTNLPSLYELEKRITINIHLDFPIHFQLIEYRQLETNYGNFYKDQLAAEMQSILQHFWENKREILEPMDNEEILSYLNESKARYNKIIYHLHQRKNILYQSLHSDIVDLSLYKRLLNIHIRIIYYSQSKQCIDQLFHRLIAILYS